MDLIASWVPIASTFSVLAPLFLLLKNFKSYELEIKALALYLAVGFLIDMAGWYFYSTQNRAAHYGLHHAYDLFEAVFLFWFLGRVSPYPRLKKLFTQAWIVLVPFWAMRFLYPECAGWFKISTQVLIAFASCFFILYLVEKTANVFRNLAFWILLGMFFYCFCTYFILGALGLVLAKVWFSHNLVNISTNLIYCIGFIREERELS